MSAFPIKSLKAKLKELDRVRKAALEDPVFNAQSEEQRRLIEREEKRKEALSRQQDRRASKKRKPKKAKSMSVLGGSRIDNAIID